MPRVLVQLNDLGLGGTQLNALDLAAATANLGYDSVLVGPRDTLPPQGPSLLDVASSRGIPLVLFDGPPRKVRGTATLNGAVHLSCLAEKSKADLVHAYSTTLTRAAYWGPCLLGRRPLVVTAYEMELEPGLQKWPSLIVGTKYLLEEQASRAGHTELISPPVDLGRDDPANVSGAEFRDLHGVRASQCALVIVSRLDEEMKATSITASIRAMDSVTDLSVVLLIVGSGSAAERLHRLADEINQRQRRRAVIMVGPMADPRPAYAAADVVIGMGGSAARGLGFGKPVIVSGEMGRFRVFTPATADALFRNSFWCNEPANNPAGELASCIRTLAADQRIRRELGSFGRAFAMENFSLGRMASKLADVYTNALRSYRVQAWLRDAPFEAAAPVRWLGRNTGPMRSVRPRPIQGERSVLNDLRHEGTAE